MFQLIILLILFRVYSIIVPKHEFFGTNLIISNIILNAFKKVVEFLYKLLRKDAGLN